MKVHTFRLLFALLAQMEKSLIKYWIYDCQNDSPWQAGNYKYELERTGYFTLGNGGSKKG